MQKESDFLKTTSQNVADQCTEKQKLSCAARKWSSLVDYHANPTGRKRSRDLATGNAFVCEYRIWTI